jgi:hypothetical protein
MRYGLFDGDGDVVDDLFEYTDRDAAYEAFRQYEAAGRNTYDNVHVGEQCGCPEGATVHEFTATCGAWV